MHEIFGIFGPNYKNCVTFYCKMLFVGIVVEHQHRMGNNKQNI